jgi:hypothetical protein
MGSDPWNTLVSPIDVIGYAIDGLPSRPDVQWNAEVGSWTPNSNATDIIGSAAGVGAGHGAGSVTGTRVMNSTSKDHFDVYANCDLGTKDAPATMQLHVHIFFTAASP